MADPHASPRNDAGDDLPDVEPRAEGRPPVPASEARTRGRRTTPSDASRSCTPTLSSSRSLRNSRPPGPRSARTLSVPGGGAHRLAGADLTDTGRTASGDGARRGEPPPAQSAGERFVDDGADARAAVIDSQSVKTTAQGGPRGYAGGKKVKGRKRQLLVDTEGLVLGAKVLPADLHDQRGGRELLQEAHEQIPTLRHLFADSSYRGKWARWAKEAMSVSVEIVRRPDANVRHIW